MVGSETNLFKQLSDEVVWLLTLGGWRSLRNPCHIKKLCSKVILSFVLSLWISVLLTFSQAFYVHFVFTWAERKGKIWIWPWHRTSHLKYFDDSSNAIGKLCGNKTKILTFNHQSLKSILWSDMSLGVLTMTCKSYLWGYIATSI